MFFLENTATTKKPPVHLPFKVVSKRPTTNTTAQPPSTKIYTTALGCNAFQYKCRTENKCVHRSWLCDAEEDCTDGSDESPDVCSSHKCAAGHFRCANGVSWIVIVIRPPGNRRIRLCPALSRAAHFRAELLYAWKVYFFKLMASVRNVLIFMWSSKKWCQHEKSSEISENFRAMNHSYILLK